MDFPILSLLIFSPLLGIPFLLLTKSENFRALRWIALVASFIPVAISGYLLTQFQIGTSEMQFVEIYKWIPAFDIKYYVGVDGIGFPLAALSALLTFICVIVSWSINKRVKEYMSLMLIIDVAMIGVFCALDFILFYAFWEVVLIPMYFLIGIWGYGNREYSAIKFFIYTFLGSVFMLLAILSLFFYSGLDTFDMVKLAASGSTYPYLLQLLAFLGFFLGFAVKIPVVPLHTWLPDAHGDAPTAGSILLAGILLKMGGYGFLRILIPMVPDAYHAFIPLIAVLGVINIVYGAYVALGQTHFKRLIAYSSIGHMGFMMLGAAALTPTALNGVMFVMIAHGFITGMLFMLAGLIYERTHTYEIAEMRGLSISIPRLSGIFVFSAIASMGLPGLAGFWGEFWVIYGTVTSPFLPGITYSVLAFIGLAVTMGYFVWLMQRMNFFSPRQAFAWQDATPREYAAMVPLIVPIVLVGALPGPLFDIMNASLVGLVR